MTAAATATGLPSLMTPLDLSEYLGVPPGTLANWRYQGRGPAFVRVGRLVRYRADDVIEWIEDQMTGANSVSHGMRPTRAVRLGTVRR